MTAGAVTLRPASAGSNFANPAVVVRSWYAAARSGDVRRRRVRSFDLLNRRIVLYRDARGTVRALDARCPHLGADLGDGSVEGEGVRCAFHGWRIGPDGRCAAVPGRPEAPGRSVGAYPTVERWGVVWIFNGPSPTFGLPGPPGGEAKWRALRMPTRTIRCHPHLVVGNGLDWRHFEELHGMEPTAPPVLRHLPPHGLGLELRGRPRSPLVRRLIRTEGSDEVVASFAAFGGSLAFATVSAPVRFHVLFSGRPAANGSACETRTILFLPKGLRNASRLLRASAVLYALLHDDARVLEGLRFSPGYTADDAPLEAFSRMIDGMEAW